MNDIIKALQKVETNDWSDYPARATFADELHFLQYQARAAYEKRRAKRMRNEILFRDTFIPWVQQTAREIAKRGHCAGQRRFPIGMNTRLGDYNISAFVRGFGHYKCGDNTATYNKARWTNGTTPFEKAVVELKEMGVTVRDVSTAGSFLVRIIF